MKQTQSVGKDAIDSLGPGRGQSIFEDVDHTDGGGYLVNQ